MIPNATKLSIDHKFAHYVRVRLGYDTILGYAFQVGFGFCFVLTIVLQYVAFSVCSVCAFHSSRL